MIYIILSISLHDFVLIALTFVVLKVGIDFGVL